MNSEQTNSLPFFDMKVIVTGGTRGIGRGLVEAFLEKGAMVACTYANNEVEAMKMAHEINEKIPGAGERLWVRKCQGGDPNAVRLFMAEIEERWQKIDILINNAGIKHDQVTPMMSDEEWSKVVNVNLDSSFYMSRAAVPMMMRNRFGRIIFMSSLAGKIALPGQINYSATKAAQIAMARVLAKEVGKKGITVNAVCPGFIETEMLSTFPEEEKKNLIKDIPVKRLGKISDVVNATLFLASKEASYITGTTIDVGGGLGI